MMTKEAVERGKRQAAEMFKKGGILIREDEIAKIEVADFGLSEFEQTGLYVLVYENNSRYCAKELAMLPRQRCPEHLHPPVGSDPGKQETFRCRWGQVFLYTSGPQTKNPKGTAAPGREKTYTVWKEVVLNPGEQHTIPPNTIHWFQAGDGGAVVSEFSSTSRDEHDIFTDKEIERFTKVVDKVAR